MDVAYGPPCLWQCQRVRCSCRAQQPEGASDNRTLHNQTVQDLWLLASWPCQGTFAKEEKQTLDGKTVAACRCHAFSQATAKASQHQMESRASCHETGIQNAIILKQTQTLTSPFDCQPLCSLLLPRTSYGMIAARAQPQDNAENASRTNPRAHSLSKSRLASKCY